MSAVFDMLYTYFNRASAESRCGSRSTCGRLEKAQRRYPLLLATQYHRCKILLSSAKKRDVVWRMGKERRWEDAERLPACSARGDSKLWHRTRFWSLLYNTNIEDVSCFLNTVEHATDDHNAAARTSLLTS
jgi:hypothetical protein